MFKQEVRVNSQIGTFLERARKEIYNRNLKPDLQGTLFYQPCSFLKTEDFHLVIKLRYSSASGLTGNENEKSKILFAGAAGDDPRGAGGRLLLAALWQPGCVAQDCSAAVRPPSATAAKPVAVRRSEPQGRLCAV